MSTRAKRIVYAVCAFLLLVTEVLIGLYVKDAFVRPYGGDVLVVILLCCLVRVVFPEKVKLLAVYVFAFAAVWEFSQMLPLVEVIGLGDNAFFRIAMGTSFAWLDIVCYAVGCALFWGVECLAYYKKKKVF